MALAKDRIPHDLLEITSLTAHGVSEYPKSVLEEEDGSQSTNGFSNDSAISHSPPLCGSGNGYVSKGSNYQPKEAQSQSLINFKANGYSNLINAGESLLSFQQSSYMKNNNPKEYCVWENSLHQGYNQWDQISPRSISNPRLMPDFSSIQTASGYGSIVNGAKEKQYGESSYGWLHSESTIPPDSLQESGGAQEVSLHKRLSMGESMQASKKQCTAASKTPKSSPSKDPQSIAAKNRRERISERLKILQELVPNGSKVDLVTMLEKAITYVKFLQLQVKVLATDEFWPVQGGKAPDISQVKEAIDAILSTQRDRNSISK